MAPIPRTANSLRAARTNAAKRQLASTGFRLCAIYGGNDVFAVFITPEQAERTWEGLPRERLAVRHLSEPPRFGMFYDAEG
jgi:hypothetical protein